MANSDPDIVLKRISQRLREIQSTLNACIDRNARLGIIFAESYLPDQENTLLRDPYQHFASAPALKLLRSGIRDSDHDLISLVFDDELQRAIRYIGDSSDYQQFQKIAEDAANSISRFPPELLPNWSLLDDRLPGFLVDDAFSRFQFRSAE